MNEHEMVQSPSTPGTNTSITSPAPTVAKERSSPSPQSTGQSAPVNRRSRKNSVQMACERCRRRKIKCSGLPGPCLTCRSLGTVCHDPGKRRDRAQRFVPWIHQKTIGLTMILVYLKTASRGWNLSQLMAGRRLTPRVWHLWSTDPRRIINNHSIANMMHLWHYISTPRIYQAMLVLMGPQQTKIPQPLTQHGTILQGRTVQLVIRTSVRNLHIG